jgi:hypothetical protein
LLPYITIAPQIPASLFTVIFAGQVIVGDWLSTTVTVKEQADEFPAPSVAVLLTVVVPTLNELPEAGEETTVAPVQSSVAGTEKETLAAQVFGALLTVILEGQVITGGVTSEVASAKGEKAFQPDFVKELRPNPVPEVTGAMVSHLGAPCQ